MNKIQHLTPKQASRRIGQIDSALAPELFKALCDPTRSKLLACLAKCGRACSVGEVAECCSVDFSVVSRHLALLARAGVLESQKQGRTVNYIVRYKNIATSLRSLADAFEQCCPAECMQRRRRMLCRPSGTTWHPQYAAFEWHQVASLKE